MQEGDVVGLQVGRDPSVRDVCIEGVDAQYRRRVVELRQVVAQTGDGQQQARLGIADDRQQARLMMTSRGLRRVGRHRDDSGVKAPKERGDVIRATGEQQHRAVAQCGPRLQGGGEGAGAQVQVAVSEDHALLGGLGEEAQGHLVGRLRGATLKGLDQGTGKFESVHHGVPA